MILEGHSGGLTQIKFSPDHNILYSGARKVSVLLMVDFFRLLRFYANVFLCFGF